MFNFRFIMALVLVMIGDMVLMTYVMRTKNSVKDWDGAVPEMPEEEMRRHKKITRAMIIFGITLVLGIVIVFSTGNIQVRYEEESCVIHANYWSDLEIPYQEIQGIEYRTGNDAGERIRGFGSLRLDMGQYKNVEFGNYTRYMYRSCDAMVVLKIKDSYVMINGKDEDHTKELYEMLNNKAL